MFVSASADCSSGIQPDKTAVPYDKLVDGSIWKDALAMLRQGH